jgi:hypothetical protein
MSYIVVLFALHYRTYGNPETVPSGDTTFELAIAMSYVGFTFTIGAFYGNPSLYITFIGILYTVP